MSEKQDMSYNTRPALWRTNMLRRPEILVPSRFQVSSKNRIYRAQKTSSDDLYESMLSAARGLKKLGISTEECADKLYEGTTALHKLSTQKYIFL
jgi:hypothetical protein